MTTTHAAPAAVLCIDPPWRSRDQLPGARGASHKYETMSTDEICEVELPPRAERHVLLLWRLASMLPDALKVLRAWGYVPCAELVWNKLRPCRTCAATGRTEVWSLGGQLVEVPGADRVCSVCLGAGGTPYLGLGHYTRGAHEVAIIARAKRGRAPERLDKAVASSFSAPMLADIDGLLGMRSAKTGKLRRGAGALVHSAKPDAFFAIVERLYAGPRVELFSRRSRPGWSSAWSDQADALDEVARVMREEWPGRVREARLAKARRAAR